MREQVKSVFSELDNSAPKTFEELNKKIIEQKGFLLKLTNEERAEAIRLGFKINSDKDADSFKRWYESQQKLGLWQKIKACFNFLFNDSIVDELEFLVLKRYIKKQESHIPNDLSLEEVAVPLEQKLKELEAQSAKTLTQRIKEVEVVKKKNNKPMHAYTVLVEENGGYVPKILPYAFQATAFSKRFKGNVPDINSFNEWLESIKKPTPRKQEKSPVSNKNTKKAPQNTRKTRENTKKDKKVG